MLCLCVKCLSQRPDPCLSLSGHRGKGGPGCGGAVGARASSNNGITSGQPFSLQVAMVVAEEVDQVGVEAVVVAIKFMVVTMFFLQSVRTSALQAVLYTQKLLKVLKLV